MNVKNAKQRQNKRKTATLPSPWRSDARPDPSVMSKKDRTNEFGKILFRAIERKRRKAQIRSDSQKTD